MKPISKSISYGYSKSVQLFSESRLTHENGLVRDSPLFVVVISERDINGDLYNVAEYRYDDYEKAVSHMRKIVINFVYADLYQR